MDFSLQVLEGIRQLVKRYNIYIYVYIYVYICIYFMYEYWLINIILKIT